MKLVKERAVSKNINMYKALYELYFEMVENGGFELADKNFYLGYSEVEYNKGVLQYFETLSKNNINNYLVSAGVKVYLDKISIAKYFKDIFATTFIYNNENKINGVDFLMTDKNKVNVIKNILQKNNIENEDCSKVIYVGDGFTDLYAMQYVKQHNGTSIFVYKQKDNKDMQAIKQNNAADFYFEADFSKNSNLYNCIMDLCKIK